MGILEEPLFHFVSLWKLVIPDFANSDFTWKSWLCILGKWDLSWRLVRWSFRLVTVYFRQIRPLKKVGVDYEALGTKTSTTYKQVQQTEQFNEKLLFKQSVRTARRIRGPMFQYWQELFISIVMSTTTINCCHDCDWKSKPSAKSNWSRIADASKTQLSSLNKAQYNDIDRSYRSLS